MPVTYEPIATQTVSVASLSVTFSSIPATYTDLVLVASITASTGGIDSLNMQFNADTASNYSTTIITGNGTSASSGRLAAYTAIIGSTIISSEITTNIFHINNYANTTTYKTVLSRGNTTSSLVRQGVGLWRSTAAITSILLRADTVTTTIAAGSTFTLYGIKAA
jgi:hypothetical protein